MRLPFEQSTEEQIQLFLKAAKRLEAVNAARDNLLIFTKLTMPDPEDQDDVSKSLFEVKPHHRLIAQTFERVEQGLSLREGLSVPPQHGKSELLSRRGIAWYIAKNPRKNVIFATYNDTFATEFGAEVRDILQSKPAKQIFPDFFFRTGSKAKDYMTTMVGGHLSFIGRGGSGTGKAADLIVIDDPLKNAEEAESPTTRRKLHEWYEKVIYTRAKKTTAIFIIQTRWHEDDLIGRLCDEEHPDRKRNSDGEILSGDSSCAWHYVNIPAVVKDPILADVLDMKLEVPTDPGVVLAFGNAPMAALWPERFDLEHLASAAALNPVTFNSLYMGKPTPDDGEYFKAADIVEYEAHQLPDRLRKYGASDHALSLATYADSSVVGCAGVDVNDDIWVLPDLVMARMDTEQLVEEMINQMQVHQPMCWYAEDDTIRKSIGPFLRKRMAERKAYTSIRSMSLAKDKMARARSAQGRMQMKKVHLPKFAPWYRDARAQLLKFPFATHDDFVDWLAHLCMGMAQQVSASVERSTGNVIKVGSLAWVKAQSKRTESGMKLAANDWR